MISIIRSLLIGFGGLFKSTILWFFTLTTAIFKLASAFFIGRLVFRLTLFALYLGTIKAILDFIFNTINASFTWDWVPQIVLYILCKLSFFTTLNMLLTLLITMYLFRKSLDFWSKE